MLVVGAKGFAKSVLEILHQCNADAGLAFYDDVSTDVGDFLFDVFPILKNEDQVKSFFETNGNEFTIGVGSPIPRYELYKKFTNLGGVCKSTISPYARVGHYAVSVAEGCTLMTGSIFSSDIKLGIGCLVNMNSIVGHDTVLGDFVEICPSVQISGNCTIGSFSFIGTNSTILPKITIGKNVIIGAGSVVTKDIPDNSLAIGTPAKVIKKLDPIDENLL